MSSPPPVVERTVTMAASGMGSLGEALSWVVGQVDGEFTAASMLTIEVGQSEVMDTNGNDWRPAWSARVSGQIPA